MTTSQCPCSHQYFLNLSLGFNALMKSCEGQKIDQENVKWRRNYKACLNCRARKVKCDMGPVDDPNGPPCLRCKRERKRCELPPARPCIQPSSAIAHIANKMDKDDIMNDKSDFKDGERNSNHLNRIFKPDLKKIDAKWKFDIYSMQNALEFLAKAAGSVASDDATDASAVPFEYGEQINSRGLESGLSADNGAAMSSDASHANFLLNSQNPQKVMPNSIPEHYDRLKSALRPKVSIKLSDIEYIGDSKMISEAEAVKLIKAFFQTMHPFFPHIPLQLQDPEELVRYPLLLCAVLTVSCRYQSFSELELYEGENGERGIEIHERLWIYCQKLMSQTIWAEASTRSIGTVLAFLLFTEWNPRAIHSRWTDYANNPDLNDVSKREAGYGALIKEADGLTGMRSIRRSDRMAWMLTGNAVRLAQDMGFIEGNCKIFTATHISETQTAMNVNQRSILAESLSEVKFDDREELKRQEERDDKFRLTHILENQESKKRWTSFVQEMMWSERCKDKQIWSDMETEFLSDEYLLYHASDNGAEESSSKSQLSHPSTTGRRFTENQRAKIELLKIISIGYETIYCDKGKQQLPIKDPTSNLAILKILSPLIESWHRDYSGLLKPLADCGESWPNELSILDYTMLIDGESLICDYSYCQLYIYSLALQVDVKENPFKLKEIAKSAKYVEIAYNAAKEILVSAERLRSLNMAKFIPVRWVTRIVRAIAFIIKCYLTLTGNGVQNNPVVNTILRLTIIPTNETLPLVERAAATLREAAPDELHLGRKYSTIISYLCSEMKMNVSRTDDGEDAVDDDADRPDADRPESNRRRSNYDSFREEEQPAADVSENHKLNSMNSLPNEVMDWFFTSEDIGLDFVDPWTEMIEQKYLQSGSGHAARD